MHRLTKRSSPTALFLKTMLQTDFFFFKKTTFHSNGANFPFEELPNERKLPLQEMKSEKTLLVTTVEETVKGTSRGNGENSALSARNSWRRGVDRRLDPWKLSGRPTHPLIDEVLKISRPGRRGRTRRWQPYKQSSPRHGIRKVQGVNTHRLASLVT